MPNTILSSLPTLVSSVSNDKMSTHPNTSTLTARPSSTPVSSSSAPEAHTCPYKNCRKSFSKKYNLKAHLRLHTGELPFQCERPDCRKKFKWRSSLSSHSVWHARKDASDAGKGKVVAKRDALQRLDTVSKNVKSKPRAKDTTPAKSSRKKQATSKQPPKQTPPHPTNKKKRPRTDTNPQKTAPVLPTSLTAVESIFSPGSTPSISPNVSCADLTSQLGLTSQHALVANGTVVKRRKISDESQVCQDQSISKMSGNVKEELAFSPGSPVTSDSGLSEPSLELDLFSCDMLPSFINENQHLVGDVSDILKTEDDGLFSFGDTEGDGLGGLERFGPFDLDNLNGFCLDKGDADVGL